MLLNDMSKKTGEGECVGRLGGGVGYVCCLGYEERWEGSMHSGSHMLPPSWSPVK